MCAYTLKIANFILYKNAVLPSSNVVLPWAQDAGFKFAFDAVRVKFKPTARDMQARPHIPLAQHKKTIAPQSCIRCCASLQLLLTGPESFSMGVKMCPSRVSRSQCDAWGVEVLMTSICFSHEHIQPLQHSKI